MSIKEYLKSTDSRTKVGNMAVVLLMMVFPLFMHDGYFDLSNSKLVCFYLCMLVFFIASIVLLVRKKISFSKEGITKSIKQANPILVMLVAVVLTQIFAKLPLETTFGLGTYGVGTIFMCFCLIGTLLLITVTPSIDFFMGTTVITAIIISLIGVFQFAGLDPFFLLYRIAGNKDVFFSTLGNAAIFGFFEVLVAPMAFYLFIEKGGKLRVIGGIGVFMSAIGVLIASTDATVLAFLVDLLGVIFIFPKSKEKASKVLMAFALVGISWFTFKLILMMATSEHYVHTICKICMHPVASLGMAAVCIFLYMDMQNRKKLSDELVCKISRVISWIGLVLFIALPVTIILYTKINYGNPNTKLASFLYFDKFWGNYRGYIWGHALNIFSGYSIIEKIFGVGCGVVGNQIYSAVTPLAYDHFNVYMEIYDAHNIYIQWMMQNGIVGLLSLLYVIGHSVYTAFSSRLVSKKVLGVSISAVAVASVFLIEQDIAPVLLIAVLALIYSGEE